MKKSIPFLFVFITLALLVQACGSPNTPTPKLTDIPEASSAQEDTDMAEGNNDTELPNTIDEYLAMLETDPDNANTHLLLGKAYQKKEMIDEAVAEYKEVKRLAELDPSIDITIPSIAQLYYDSGDYEKAIPEYIEVIKENPDTLEEYIPLGFCYYQLGKYEEAAEQYEKLLEQDPDYPIALFGLGSIYYYKLGEFEKALPLLQHFLEVEPKTKYREEAETMIADITGVKVFEFEGETNAGILLKADTLNSILASLNCDSASEVKSKITFSEPEDGTEGQIWGEEEWLIKACDETKLFAITFTADGEGGTFFDTKEIDIATDTTGLTVEEHLDLAQEYYTEGETDKEIEEYLAVLEMEPDNVQALAFLGLTYHLEKNRTEDGIANLRRALALSPNNASALMYLGFIYYDIEKYTMAIPLFEKFLDLHPDHEFKNMVAEMLNEAKTP